MSNLPSSPSSSPSDTSATLEAANRRSRNKRLATLLLAATVSALVVVADHLVESYAEGDFFVIWLVLWAVGFAALALFADAARKSASRLLAFWGGWAQRRTQRQSDAYLRALAARDPRIMAELQAAVERTETELAERQDARGRRWLARQPTGTFNAAYQGPRRGFCTTPMTGLPTHLQFLPN